MYAGRYVHMSLFSRLSGCLPACLPAYLSVSLSAWLSVCMLYVFVYACCTYYKQTYTSYFGALRCRVQGFGCRVQDLEVRG